MSSATAAPTRLASRSFTSLAGAVILLGLADSLVGAYFILFLANEAALSPLQIGLLFSLPTIGGIACSLYFGHRFDIRPTRTWTVIAAASSAVGYALLTTTTSFAWLLIISIVFFAAYQAAYPQLFSMARHVLGDGVTGRRAAPLLRSGWSLSWAIGPLLGAALVPLVGFEGVLWAAVILLALMLPILALVPSLRTPPPTPPGSAHETTADAPVHLEALKASTEPSAEVDQPASPATRPALSRAKVAMLTASVTIFFGTMFAGSIALPLYVTRGLGLSEALVGWMYSLCAVVEIVAALGIAALPQSISQRALITIGMLALAGHFALVVLADDAVLLLVSQVPRGVAIAVVSAVGIRFFQDVMAPATGFASTLFSTGSDAGFLLSGLLGGLAVQQLGYQPSLVIFVWSRSWVRRSSPRSVFASRDRRRLSTNDRRTVDLRVRTTIRNGTLPHEDPLRNMIAIDVGDGCGGSQACRSPVEQRHGGRRAIFCSFVSAAVLAQGC